MDRLRFVYIKDVSHPFISFKIFKLHLQGLSASNCQFKKRIGEKHFLSHNDDRWCCNVYSRHTFAFLADIWLYKINSL